MRGEARLPEAIHHRGRITPACAGRSLRGYRTGRRRWDHPRVCGEKQDKMQHVVRVIGSPPRVRGEAESTVSSAMLTRITPACAGRSGRTGAQSSSTWDHPRVCGEKFSPRTPESQMGGSPPRVRGEGGEVVTMTREQRITPACAGRSEPTICAEHSSKDHPRVCGEKCVFAECTNAISGSPPRVRGEVIALRDCVRTLRITPACAGRRPYTSGPSSTR